MTKEDGLIDPRTDSLQKIYSKYRGYFLRPKIHFLHDGKRVIIEKLSINEETFDPHGKMMNENNELHPSITDCQVKPEGKKLMSREDFMRGYKKS